jgi:hypothetical protein
MNSDVSRDLCTLWRASEQFQTTGIQRRWDVLCGNRMAGLGGRRRRRMLCFSQLYQHLREINENLLSQGKQCLPELIFKETLVLIRHTLVFVHTASWIPLLF